jgi:hypothetical protein
MRNECDIVRINKMCVCRPRPELLTTYNIYASNKHKKIVVLTIGNTEKKQKVERKVIIFMILLFFNSNVNEKKIQLIILLAFHSRKFKEDHSMTFWLVAALNLTVVLFVS